MKSICSAFDLLPKKVKFDQFKVFQIMIAQKSPDKYKEPTKKVPDNLVYEIIDGRPFYYKNYREVISGIKSLAEIMGSSSLQSFILSYLLSILFNDPLKKNYRSFTNEAGLHLDKHNNLSGDILIYDRANFSIESINKNHFSTPPKIVVEVDIAVDTKDLSNEGYVHSKTRKLLAFGVEKVIWITTSGKTVLVATPHDDWQIKDWQKEIELLDGVFFNIGRYLQEEGLDMEL